MQPGSAELFWEQELVGDPGQGGGDWECYAFPFFLTFVVLLVDIHS